LEPGLASVVELGGGVLDCVDEAAGLASIDFASEKQVADFPGGHLNGSGVVEHRQLEPARRRAELAAIGNVEVAVCGFAHGWRLALPAGGHDVFAGAKSVFLLTHGYPPSKDSGANRFVFTLEARSIAASSADSDIRRQITENKVASFERLP
jgi:hypothetical protein